MDFFVGMHGLELHAFDHAELDVTDFGKLKGKFEDIKPDLVINCSAYTAVDEAEGNHDLAFKINAEAVGEIAKLAKSCGAVLIHFSTDYVFDGARAGGYKEDDATGPLNVYGASKLAGENLLMENTDKYYLIRSSWLFGKNGKNFVDTMIRLGENTLESGEELKVVDDQIGSPTYTHDLVNTVIENFINPLVKHDPKGFGIYHLTNSGTCSWYDFAKEIFAIKKMDVKILAVSSSQFPRPAKRPASSILLNTKLPLMRSWKNALGAYLG